MFNQYLKSVSGIVIISCFSILIFLVLKQNNTNSGYLNKSTITRISSSNNLIKITRLLCFAVAFFIPLFITFLIQELNLDYKQILIALSLISAIALTITSLTLKKNDSMLHVLPAGSFFVSMLLIQIMISILTVKQIPILGFFGLSLIIGNVILALMAQADSFFSGTDEAMLMGISALWVTVFQIASTLI